MFKTIIPIFYREVRRITEDHTLVLSLLLAPLFYLFFYGSIYMNKVEEEVPLAVIDNSKSELSRAIIRFIDASREVQVIPVVSSSDALTMIKEDKVIGSLFIPKDLEKGVKSLKGSDLELRLNNSRFLPSNDINSVVTKVALTVGAGVRLLWEEQHGSSAESALWKAQPLNLKDHPMFVTPISYGGFLLPGILLLILQQTLLIGLAESTARERELKTTSQWLRGSLFSAVVGKGLFYFLLYGAYAFFVHAVNYPLLDLTNLSSFWALTLLFTLFFILLIIIGILAGTLFKRELYALQTFAFSSYPFFLISGYSWPVTALPFWIKPLALAIPTTPMLDAYQKLVIKGADFSMIYGNIVHLGILILAYTTLLVLRLQTLKKNECI